MLHGRFSYLSMPLLLLVSTALFAEDTGRGGIFGDHSAELIIRGNRVSGSGGEGLGIEIWGGCPRSLIEDNVIDHWLSVDKGDQSAVRRNIIGTGAVRVCLQTRNRRHCRATVGLQPRHRRSYG